MKGPGGVEAPLDPPATSGVSALPAAPPPGTPGPDVLAPLRTTLTPGEIVRKLDAVARRGRLGGFEPGRGGGAAEPLFVVGDMGTPFEGELRAYLRDGALVFEPRLHRRLPAVFAAILILSVYPGVLLMDSLMRVYFPSVSHWTWWWYIPLTALSAPPAYFAAVRRSRAVLMEDARGAVERIAEALGGVSGSTTAAPTAAGHSAPVSGA